MFILKKGHQPGVYVPLRALFLVSWRNCLSVKFRISWRKRKLRGEMLEKNEM